MGGTRTRTVDFDEPGATATGALGKTGIEFLREIIAGKLLAAPMQASLGFELV